MPYLKLKADCHILSGIAIDMIMGYDLNRKHTLAYHQQEKECLPLENEQRTWTDNS